MKKGASIRRSLKFPKRDKPSRQEPLVQVTEGSTEERKEEKEKEMEKEKEVESEGLVVDDNNVFYPTQMIDNIRDLGKV